MTITIKRSALVALLVQLYRMQGHGTKVSETWAELQIEKFTDGH